MQYAAVLLDLVKAFERVPRDWLVRQAVKYEYPLLVLKLSLAAYSLQRTIGIDGIFSTMVVAVRGITAGSVHATIELRVLLIQFLDEAYGQFPYVTLT
eukprot:1260699-Karenia_brevis.AAC.1